MSSVLEKARELGDELVKSQEMEDMKNAQQKVMDDPEAKAIVDEFQQKQQSLYQLQQQGHQLTEEQQKEVEDLENKMTDNPVIVEYITAQQNFEKLLENINSIISQAISGQAPSCDDDCCTSCGGGCDA